MGKNSMKNGDIILLSDGRIFKVIDSVTWDKNLVCVEFIDKNEHSYIEKEKLDIERNLGDSSEVTLHFHATKGIHVRFNRISSI